MARYLTGTIAQLAGKLSLNGVTLGQPELSVMTRIFNGAAFKQVGQVKKAGERGRPALVWQLDTEAVTQFVCTDTAGLAASDADAPEFVAPAKAATA